MCTREGCVLGSASVGLIKSAMGGVYKGVMCMHMSEQRKCLQVMQ